MVYNCQRSPYVNKMMNHENMHTDLKSIQSIKGKSKRSKSKQQPSDFQFKGMTLKEYFRLNQNPYEGLNNKIDELDEDEYCSSKEAGTPCFSHFKHPHDIANHIRQKVKTETHKEEFFLHKKNENYNNLRKSGESCFKNKMTIVGLQKNLQTQHKQSLNLETKKNHEKSNPKHRIISIPQNKFKNDKYDINRSTLSSFYQQEKKKKMLHKLKLQKEKLNDPRFSDLFYISKYGKKFNFDMKEVSK